MWNEQFLYILEHFQNTEILWPVFPCKYKKFKDLLTQKHLLGNIYQTRFFKNLSKLTGVFFLIKLQEYVKFLRAPF